MTTSQTIHQKNMRTYNFMKEYGLLNKKTRSTKKSRKSNIDIVAKAKTIAYIMAASISLLGVYTKVSYNFLDNMRVEASQGLISPVPAPTPTPVIIYKEKVIDVDSLRPRTEKEIILDYIVEKFGDHAADAIAMIRLCENSSFSQSSVNVNRNSTIDYGVMQINSIHIPKCGEGIKTDYKANIDCGHKIWKQSNNSFYQWSCAGTINQESYKDNL